MFERFQQNSLFHKRIEHDRSDADPQNQMKEILRVTRDCGLDWYFTGVPDLRCGRKQMDGDRASGVCFSLKLSKSGPFEFRNWDDIGINRKELPLSKVDMKRLEDFIRRFAIKHSPREVGYLPDDYVATDLRHDFDRSVHRSLKDDRNRRLRRLSSATSVPNARQILITVFDRNPDVVAEALALADGACSRCHQPAPFLQRRDGLPYLEVHHVKPLSEGGLDTLKNVMVLCPNCHRHAHHG